MHISTAILWDIFQACISRIRQETGRALSFHLKAEEYLNLNKIIFI